MKVGEATVHHGAGLLESLRTSAHEHAAEVKGAIRANDLVGYVQVSGVEEFVVEATQYGLILFGHRERPPSPAFPGGLASSLTMTACSVPVKRLVLEPGRRVASIHR